MKIDANLDQKFINIDPLKKTYYQSIVNNPERKRHEQLGHIALMCIDLQYLDAARGFGVFEEPELSGIQPEAQEYYFTTLEKTVFPNVRRLQDFFRSYHLEVIHCRIQSLTQDGRDRSPGHKNLRLLAAPGSREADFIEQVAPVGDEIIINKTASGVFTSTNLEFVLHNLKIDSLFMTGVYTNECVETTVRSASDLGFFVTLVEDGCTTVTQQLHDYSIATLRDRYARVLSTEETIREITRNLAE